MYFFVQFPVFPRVRQSGQTIPLRVQQQTPNRQPGRWNGRHPPEYATINSRYVISTLVREINGAPTTALVKEKKSY